MIKSSNRRALIGALIFLLIAVGSTFGQTAKDGEAEVRQMLAKFVRAFDDLDWETFRQSFDDDATVFYPRAFPERANGRAEFEKFFKVVFEQIRNGRTKPPYMDLQPRALQIQMHGDVAIVTFHLDDRTGFVNRRTLVVAKHDGVWKIIHLHASEVAVPVATR